SKIPNRSSTKSDWTRTSNWSPTRLSVRSSTVYYTLRAPERSPSVGPTTRFGKLGKRPTAILGVLYRLSDVLVGMSCHANLTADRFVVCELKYPTTILRGGPRIRNQSTHRSSDLPNLRSLVD